MHSVVLELQEANKDVLVGKRNFNCLSCGIKDGATPMNPQAKSSIHGTDGRLYRGNQGFAELADIGASKHKRYSSRVASAHPRANRISELVKEANEPTGVSSVFNTTMNGNGGGVGGPAPYGISAEVRMRSNQHSRMSHKNTNVSSSHQFDAKSGPALSHVHSDAKFPGGHQRKKLPIGFLV
mmetsp:Transcript_44673/g.59264  ORF Transcript_44673/g.59264 Transcript_44673/m.59264 type:complete len:182 (-) Transcript_44673:480-1025(-)